MSHWQEVETQVTDIDLLEAAVTELGGTCKRDSIARGYARADRNTSYGKDQHCDMAISLPNCKYDIAVKKTADGSYSMEVESGSYQMRKTFEKSGHRFGKILEMYLVHQAESLCRKKKKKWERVMHSDRIAVEVSM